MRGWRLHFRSGNIELPPGEHFIGRAVECLIRIDQPMVSRRHARLVVGEEVFFEDLESRNGSLLNGRPVYGPRRVQPGDKIFIGNEEFELALAEPTGHSEPVKIPGESAWDDRDTSTELHYVELANLGENLIAEGRLIEAEGLVERALARLDFDIAEGFQPTAPIVEEALRRACRMAELTSKPVWIERMLGFAGSIHVVLPAPLIDQLQALLKQTPLAVRPALEDYLSKVTTQMSWNEQTRFLVARIEQLRLLVP
ncbi:MAG TPA: FHA domain-containing protein [Polyangia bacterium]|nr:FHA domain-containing protein [Polyangia bacterium]